MNNYPSWLNALLNQADEHAITFLDVEGRIVEWSAGATRIYGYTRDEALARSASMIFVPEDAERGIFEHELAVARAGGHMEDDRWMLRKDGQRVWVTGIAQAIVDDHGEVVGFSKIMRNRTDLKIRMDAIDGEFNSLKAIAEQHRTFVAVLAHELRNPLAPIKNLAEILRLKGRESEDLRPLADMLDRQVATLTKLVADLMDVTRVTQRKIHCEKVPVDLTILLQQVADSALPEMESRAHQFWLHVPPTSIVVLGDPIRLQQVFMNLLNNAIKYTPDGGRIYLRATTDSNAIITVEDNGMGIPPEMLPQIFELFTQEDDREQRTRSGLGIGLALVKELVSLHDGTVQARSDGKNKGSVFTVQLPLAQA
jgi:two-component system CheB/CheR fusion protein